MNGEPVRTRLSSTPNPPHCLAVFIYTLCRLRNLGSLLLNLNHICYQIHDASNIVFLLLTNSTSNIS